ncbi:hypothetical protein GCM10027294_22880 [Marinactinospora endophytica]
MGVNLQVLPPTITMMAGPQIISAIILVTGCRAVRASLAFLAGVAVAVTTGVAVARGLFTVLGDAMALGPPSDSGSSGVLIQAGLVVLLLAVAVKAFVRRETAEPPRWLGGLLAGVGRAFATGLLVVLVMPSDVIVMLTVGVNLAHNGAGPVAALPFVAATVLVAALPLLAVVVLHRRARRVMPAVRDRLNSHSRVVTVVTSLGAARHRLSPHHGTSLPGAPRRLGRRIRSSRRERHCPDRPGGPPDGLTRWGRPDWTP